MANEFRVKKGLQVDGDATVTGDLTVDGTTTTINTATLDVEDTNVTVNSGGNDASSEGAGITVERTGTDGSVVYEDALTSKFKIGAVGSEVEVVTISGAQAITAKDIDGGTASNTSRVTLPKDTTTNLDLLTDKEATIAYDTTQNKVVMNDGTGWTAVDAPTSASQSGDLTNHSLANSVGVSALTVALKDASGNDPSAGSPVTIRFRNSTAATGTTVSRSVTGALSVVVSSGSTLGHTDTDDHYIYVYALDNSGTVELALSSSMWDEGELQTTTAEGGAGAADSRITLYSTTARTDVPIRLLGRLKSSQTTAGTWAAVATEISLVPFEKNVEPTVFSAYRTTSDQTITAGAGATEVIFNGERQDNKGIYSTSTGRFTAQKSDWHILNYHIQFAVGATAASEILTSMKINGTGTLYAVLSTNNLANSEEYSLTASARLFLNEGDYVSVFAECTGQDVDVRASGNDLSSFSGNSIT